MADITDPIVVPAESAAEGANYIRQRFIAMFNSDHREMQQVHDKLVEHGTAVIAAALGGPLATQLQTIYNAKKNLNNAIYGPAGTNPNPTKVIPDIP